MFTCAMSYNCFYMMWLFSEGRGFDMVDELGRFCLWVVNSVGYV